MRVALIPNSVALAHHLTMSVGPSGLALGLTLDVVVPVATASSSSVLTESDVQRLIAMYKDDYARCWVDTFATVDDRFPGLAASNGGGGKVMVDFLLAVFQDHAVKLLQYFHEGERMLFRSAINDRNEESSRIEYKNRILQRGMNSHGRSKAVSIKKQNAPLQSDRPCPRDLLAAAHTAEALYLAHADAPNNVQVRQAIACGSEVIELHQNIPEYMQRFFVFCDESR